MGSTIEQNNRLIAEFMGFKKSTQNNDYFEWDGFGSFRKDQMLFDKDWSWLMEVVVKIRGFYHNSMASRSEAKSVIETLSYVDKNITYSACVKFIQWHNQQPK